MPPHIDAMTYMLGLALSEYVTLRLGMNWSIEKAKLFNIYGQDEIMKIIVNFQSCFCFKKMYFKAIIFFYVKYCV